MENPIAAVTKPASVTQPGIHNAMAIRFGVVGTAHWARKVHIPGLLATPGAGLTGIFSRNAQNARAAADAHGVRAFDDFQDMLDCVDAVSIAVPPAAQPEFAIAAARRGKHLLLEKPIASSLRDAEAIRNAASGKVCAIAFYTRRFVPVIEQAIDNAARQSWQRATVRLFSSALATPGPYNDSVWRKEQGAALWDSGPHALSILIPILGAVTRVSAYRDSDSISRMVSVHASGATAETSMTLHATADQVSRDITLFSSTGQATIPYPDVDFAQTYTAAASELLAMIANGTRLHRCDLDFGVEVVRILGAAEQSLQSGRPVELAAGSGRPAGHSDASDALRNERATQGMNDDHG